MRLCWIALYFLGIIGTNERVFFYWAIHAIARIYLHVSIVDIEELQAVDLLVSVYLLH